LLVKNGSAAHFKCLSYKGGIAHEAHGAITSAGLINCFIADKGAGCRRNIQPVGIEYNAASSTYNGSGSMINILPHPAFMVRFAVPMMPLRKVF